MLRLRVNAAFAFAAIMGYLAACESTSSREVVEQTCAPGESKECTCVGGSKSAQVCNDDGTGYRSCACGAGGTGGSGGSGGINDGGALDGGGASGGNGGSAGASGCASGLPGPALVQVPEPSGGSYCMDATEVTNGDYATFLAASPSTGGQSAYCSWNTTYVPTSGWPATGQEAYPVTYVDWCDATAYCKWAGKRLCGRIDGDTNAYGDYADATKSQWHNACSKGGTQTYPYGSTYSGSTCVGAYYDGAMGYQIGSDVALPAGGATGCQGGYPGLFDLSGNVWEWEDSCDGVTGTEDKCRLRGGSFVSSDVWCDISYGLARAGPDFVIGFRCCSD
jgi:hypothetical protein